MLALARRLALLTAVSIYNTWWLRLLNVTFSFKRSEWGLARRARPDVLPFLSFSDRLRLFYSLWSHCFLVFYFLAATASLDTNRTAPIVSRPNRMVSTAGSPAKAGSDTVHYIRNSSFVSRLSLSPSFTQRKSLEWRYLSRCSCKYRCSCGPPPSDMAVQGSIAEGDGNGSLLLRRSSGSATATAQSHRMLLKSARYPASQVCSVGHWSVAALQQRASFAFALFRLVVIVAASTVVDAVFLLHVRIFNNSAANAVYFRLTRTGALRRRQPLPLLNRPPTCPLPIWIPYVSVSYSLFGSP